MSESYPSYEEHYPSGLVLSKPGGRLFWNLQGPLSTSVFVMDEDENPDGPREAFSQQTLSEVIWHSIAELAATEPKVSSIAVTESSLDMWEVDWEESHQHAEPGLEGVVFAEAENEDEQPDLLQCCGETRPKTVAPLVVRASEKGFVTILDCVSQVHPWLMGLRGDISRAMNVWEGQALPDETKLMVFCHAPQSVMVREEQLWIGRQRSRPAPQNADDDSLSIEEYFHRYPQLNNLYVGDLGDPSTWDMHAL